MIVTEHNRTACGGCGFDALQQILDLGASPLANDFPEERHDIAMPWRYPLGLVRCPKCTLVQSTAVVPDDLVWRQDYAFYTGTSAELRTYFKAYYEWLRDYISPFPHGNPLIVEIGCNDGTLLQHLRGWVRHAVGVDPAKGPTEQARANGLDVHTDLFGRRVAEQLRDTYGPAGLIIANNVAAHVADLDDFFGGLAHLLADGGAAVIEVQYLPDLIIGNGFDLIYHEHRYFFSGHSLANIAGRYGLEVVKTMPAPTQGGSIRVVFAKGDAFHYPVQSPLRDQLGEAWLSEPAGMALQGRADRIRRKLNEEIDAFIGKGHTIAGYGAPAKATTLAAWIGLDVDRVRWMEDTTPAKWDRYLPGTSIPVISPESAPSADVFLLTIHNYARGILRKEIEFMARGGRFLLPLPAPLVI